jgi:pilus assembly protein Flp/PilA
MFSPEFAELGLGVRFMKRLTARFIMDQSGATAIEYGLIAGLIAVVIIAAVTKLGTSISAKFGVIANNLT